MRPTRARSPEIVSFNRRELDQILRIYGNKVADGEWRDYAIDMLRDSAVFSVFKRAAEVPLYRIEKNPKLARKQGAWSITSAGGQILKRGHELHAVLRMFEAGPGSTRSSSVAIKRVGIFILRPGRRSRPRPAPAASVRCRASARTSSPTPASCPCFETRPRDAPPIEAGCAPPITATICRKPSAVHSRDQPVEQHAPKPHARGTAARYRSNPRPGSGRPAAVRNAEA